jgi:hypothetical protein
MWLVRLQVQILVRYNSKSCATEARRKNGAGSVKGINAPATSNDGWCGEASKVADALNGKEFPGR